MMEYEERIDSVQGNYIVASDPSFENILNKKPLEIEGLTIQPGELTTLYDWFTKPVKYVGFLGNAAIFFLGGGKPDLFGTGGYYYDQTIILTKNRVVKSYRPGTARDMFLTFKKNKWTWFNK